MKKRVLDTNALLSFVTDRNLKQQQAVARVFEDAAALKSILYCPHHVLSEFVFVLDSVYDVPQDTIKNMARELINSPGIELVFEVDMKALFRLWPAKITDYGDAVVAAVCLSFANAEIVTFDRKFCTALKRAGILYWQA